jgi:rubrerythrin
MARRSLFMSYTTPLDLVIVEGFYGVPVKIDPTTVGQVPGTVEWLLDAVERHARAETESLAQYDELAQASGDPVVALVMRLILEDEERHHGLLRRIEATLKDALNWTRSPVALPATTPPQQPLAADLASIAKALITEEKTAARNLRDLAQRGEDVGAGLNSLLLEMMALDCDKHALLLEFVQHRLALRALAADGPGD